MTQLLGLRLSISELAVGVMVFITESHAWLAPLSAESQTWLAMLEASCRPKSAYGLCRWFCLGLRRWFCLWRCWCLRCRWFRARGLCAANITGPAHRPAADVAANVAGTAGWLAADGRLAIFGGRWRLSCRDIKIMSRGSGGRSP